MVYHIIDFGLVSLSSMQKTSGWTYAASSAHSRSSGQSCMHRHLASTRKETQLLISLHDRQYQLGNAQTSGAQQVVHVSQQQCMSLRAGALPIVHSLTRVEKPSPTQRHPLAGIWRSTGMLHTCIMTLRYDFSSRAASVVGTQVATNPALHSYVCVCSC